MPNIKVRNIDISCEDHEEGFGVHWDGELAVLIPQGESRVLPEYLGEHFANKLTEHLALKQEDELQRSLPKDKREAIKAEIIEEYIDTEEDNNASESIPHGHGHVVDPLEHQN